MVDKADLLRKQIEVFVNMLKQLYRGRERDRDREKEIDLGVVVRMFFSMAKMVPNG